MGEFIYNEGSGAHRGVWHLAKGPVILTDVPETVKDNTHQVVDYSKPTHGVDRLPGVEYYAGYWTTYRDEYYPVLGIVTYRLVTPAHRTYEGVAACGSGTFTGSSLRYLNWTKAVLHKRNVGKSVEVASHRVASLAYRSGGEPPEPFCGNCLKTMGV